MLETINCFNVVTFLQDEVISAQDALPQKTTLSLSYEPRYVGGTEEAFFPPFFKKILRCEFNNEIIRLFYYFTTAV